MQNKPTNEAILPELLVLPPVPPPSNLGSVEVITKTNNQSAPEYRLKELYELLGEKTVLLPVRAKEKHSWVKQWNDVRFEETQAQAFQLDLSVSPNHAVLLGKASEGLCAIDIDEDLFVDPFLEVNPLLKETLRTRGSRGCQIWVRAEGEYPKLTPIKTDAGEKWGEWRSDGAMSIVSGIHPHGMQYQRIVSVKPVKIAFEQIVWPVNVLAPQLKSDADRLVEEHGEPYALGPRGVLQINEIYFVAKYQREHPVIWEPMEGRFYEYDHSIGLWSAQSEDKIRQQFGLDMKRVADEVDVKGFLWKRGSDRQASLTKSLKGFAEERDAFKQRAPVIHLSNGMLDLRDDSPKLMGFHPDYHSRNICPINLDPEAQCPRFVDGLLRSSLDDDDCDLLQRWAGGVLLGNNPAQRILLLIGTPGGGKSTLIEIIEKIIGERNVAQLRTKHLGERFETYRFLGKTLLTGKEVKADFLNAEEVSAIKALVGNDLLDAEKKNGNEHCQLRGSYNVAITCNTKLRVKLEGDTGAWERRLMIVNYSKPKPKERIPEFADLLIREEGAGILNWMIEGAIKYLQDIKQYGDLCLSNVQNQRVVQMLKESDSVRQFVEQRVVRYDDQDVSVAELLEAYLQFCEDMGWQPVPAQNFRSALGEIMLDVHHVSRRNDIDRDFGRVVRGFKHVMITEGRR